MLTDTSPLGKLSLHSYLPYATFADRKTMAIYFCPSETSSAFTSGNSVGRCGYEYRYYTLFDKEWKVRKLFRLNAGTAFSGGVFNNLTTQAHRRRGRNVTYADIHAKWVQIPGGIPDLNLHPPTVESYWISTFDNN
jgi:hypothetical protein